MNRHLVTVIDFTGSQSRRDALPPKQAQGLTAPVAYAHDCGRERDGTKPSGEGPG